MEGREGYAIPSFFLLNSPGGPFSPQSVTVLHAPPGFRPMSKPTLQPFPSGEQRQHQYFSHGIPTGISASPTMQRPLIIPTPPASVDAEEPMVKEKRKYVPDDEGCDLGVSSVSKPKRGRGRPPGTGRRQRLAKLGGWMSTSAGYAFATHMISVDAGEDIVSKVLSFSQQRQRSLCVVSGTGTVSELTLRQSGSSAPTLSFQGKFNIEILNGCYLVNEEGGTRSRTGGISVHLSRYDGYQFGGTVETLIAASLVQVFVCSFKYRSAKPKVIKQENVSKEDNTTKKDNSMETQTSEQPSPAATESAAEAAQTPLDYSSPGWAGSGGGTDSRNNNHLTD